MSVEPTFLIIGAQKCGTTSMYYYLSEHPQVFVPTKIKEIAFFSDKYSTAFNHYLKYFKGSENYVARGEATPNYSSWPHSKKASERIARHLPNVKIIYMVRHPLERLASAYVQLLENGTIDMPFNRAVRDDRRLLETSRYWSRISDYRKYFADENIQCVFLEDLKADPNRTLRRCFEYLNVDPTVSPPSARHAWGTREDKTIPRKCLPNWIRQSNIIRSIYDEIPMRWRERIKPLHRSRLTAETTWDKGTIKWAADQISEDAAEFLRYSGKPQSFWSLDSPYRDVT